MKTENTITIVGLGPGDFGSLTIDAYEAIKGAKILRIRTKEHPVVSELSEKGIEFETYDSFYESAENFEGLYERIANDLIELSKTGDVTYAVPGNPFVGESVVATLMKKEESGDFKLKVIPGMSSVDVCAQAARADIGEGITVLDGYSMVNAGRANIDPKLPLLVIQIPDRFVLGNVVDALTGAAYPEDTRVALIRHAGLKDESVSWMSLYNVLREEPDHLTSLFVPPVDAGTYSGFYGLVELVEKLRSPDGCPWDGKQTHDSLKPYILEEAYEAINAIDNKDYDNLSEEMGDLLFQVVIQSQIGKENGEFDVDDVTERIIEKMLRRHPHVFGDFDTKDVKKIYGVWDEIKREEKGLGSIAEDMAALPKTLPAVVTAGKIQSKARKVGFDWDSPYLALEKVYEEAGEVKDVLDLPDSPEKAERLRDEIGDLLFACINVARLSEVDSEDAIRGTNKKFIKRFGYIEQEAAKLGKDLKEMSLDEMEALWQDAKL